MVYSVFEYMLNSGIGMAGSYGTSISSFLRRMRVGEKLLALRIVIS